MNRTIRAIIGVVLVLVIAFSAISVCQNIGKSLKVDVTERNLYTLSEGTKAILANLNQPVKVKLFFAETAALKGPDQIRYFTNYYRFVKSLLEEYVAAGNGMIDLHVIDPRPFSEDEAQAMRYGLKRFPVTEEENFFFGLVVQTQFGVEKSIPFFSPDRQNFIEYDISSLIDGSITRQKKRIGILSSLPVMGDDMSGYMAQMMRMQGQSPKPAWTFIEQLKNKYKVESVATDVEEIKDIDILLVIHPKDLPEKTLFAIDQFVLKNGRAIICVDPHCFADAPDSTAMRSGRMPSQSSNVDELLRTWGLQMEPGTFAGDRSLALKASMNPDQRPELMIGFLNLVPGSGCFNNKNVITTDLNQVRLLFSGVLKEINETGDDAENDNEINKTPILMTTSGGNSWSVSSPFELMALNPTALMAKFVDGTEPVNMGYLVTGRFKSSFPEGVEIEIKTDEDELTGETDGSNESKKITKKQLTGLKESENDCAVIVFADVDFISDMIAYQDTFLGKMAVGDNSTLMLNAVDELGGSSDLISIRSRGSFRRSFIVVDNIEALAERETAAEESKINAAIVGYQNELQSVLATTEQGEEGSIIGSSILQKKKEIELKIHQAQIELRKVKMKRREKIESLGNLLQNFNMLMAPVVILIIAIVLSVRRSAKRRYYVSHPGDS